MIKIVHIITKLELGGAQINTIYTFKNLDKNNFEVFLLSGEKGILAEKVKSTPNFIVIKDLIRNINPMKDLRALWNIRKVLKMVKPEIVHTHSSKAGILGRIAAFLAGVPVTIHSVHGFSFSPSQSFFIRSLYIIAEKAVSKLTDHFVFVSRQDIEIAKKKKLIRKGHSMIRSGFPMKSFTKPEQDMTRLKNHFKITKDNIVCGIIAPFKPQKGLFHLLKIAKRVIKAEPRTVFIIAGDGDLRVRIVEQLERMGIRENFRLPGFISPIAAVIDIFDIGISTALWEGLPQSLVQIRIKGKPVVASDIPGNREVIIDGKNGFLVDVLDYSQFAEKILELIKNHSLRKTFGNFKQDFSEWDGDFMVKKQEQLYYNLLNRGFLQEK